MYQVAVSGTSPINLSYDSNGNLLNDGSGKTYQWDAENRLIKITQASGVSTFAYDGLGRRTQESLNSALTKQWVWSDDAQPSEEWNSGGSVTKRFFPQGEQIGGTNYFYTRDHLGSVREMTDSGGTIQARYDYDSYGRSSKLSGSLDADFGFSGAFFHIASGLNLARFREYDPNLGRWLNPDPIGLAGGANLYSYVDNNPVNAVDPLGLFDIFGFGSATGATPGPVRAAAEGVGLVGYDSKGHGFYAGTIGLGGVEVGGQQNYIAVFGGKEVTTEDHSPKQITIQEGSFGPEVRFVVGGGITVGRYSTADEKGVFISFGGGALGDHAAVGFGFSYSQKGCK
jgi:RHS repeat-associated protein